MQVSRSQDAFSAVTEMSVPAKRLNTFLLLASMKIENVSTELEAGTGFQTFTQSFAADAMHSKPINVLSTTNSFDVYAKDCFSQFRVITLTTAIKNMALLGSKIPPLWLLKRSKGCLLLPANRTDAPQSYLASHRSKDRN